MISRATRIIITGVRRLPGTNAREIGPNRTHPHRKAAMTGGFYRVALAVAARPLEYGFCNVLICRLAVSRLTSAQFSALVG